MVITKFFMLTGSEQEHENSHRREKKDGQITEKSHNTPPFLDLRHPFLGSHSNEIPALVGPNQ